WVQEDLVLAEQIEIPARAVGYTRCSSTIVVECYEIADQLVREGGALNRHAAALVAGLRRRSYQINRRARSEIVRTNQVVLDKGIVALVIDLYPRSSRPDAVARDDVSVSSVRASDGVIASLEGHINAAHVVWDLD